MTPRYFVVRSNSNRVVVPLEASRYLSETYFQSSAPGDCGRPPETWMRILRPPGRLREAAGDVDEDLAAVDAGELVDRRLHRVDREVQVVVDRLAVAAHAARCLVRGV